MSSSLKVGDAITVIIGEATPTPAGIYLPGAARPARVSILDVTDEENGYECFGYTLGAEHDPARELSPDGYNVEDNEGATWARGHGPDVEAALRASFNLGANPEANLVTRTPTIEEQNAYMDEFFAGRA